jgi:hypothetical protein
VSLLGGERLPICDRGEPLDLCHYRRRAADHDPKSQRRLIESRHVQGAVNAIVVLLVAAAGSLGGAAVSISSTDTGNPNGFIVGAIACFAAATVIVVLYYLVHPALRALGTRRRRILEAHPRVPGDGLVSHWRERRRSRPTRVRPPVDASGPLVIRSALYGDFRRHQGSIDVTAAVTALAQGGQLDFVVSNSVLGGDPAPNMVKTLKIEYTLGGSAYAQQWDEGDHVVLP